MALGLLDCSLLAVIRVQTLKNGMKRSGSRGIFKMQVKRDSSRLWSGMMVFWALLKQNSTLNRIKLIKNWEIGMRN